MKTLLIAISSNNISLVCNLILLGIIILCVISCFMGLKKGLIKSALKFFVWLILILFVYSCNINFAKMVYNTNISFIINTFHLNQTIIIDETNIYLTQTIGKIVQDILKAYNISSSYDAVSALSISIISFATLIVNMFLCLLISPIITFILYICLIKPIFNKIMKKHKLRIGGFFVNGLKTLMVSTAFLMPLFSVTEVMINNYNDAVDKGYTYDEQTSNKYWNILYPFIKGYNSSILHGFFSILTGQGKNNGFYTVQVKNSDTKVNFVEVLGDAFAVTCSTLSVAPNVSQAALISALLTDNTLELLTTKILNNAFLVKEVIPITASISLNLLSNDEKNIILSKQDAEELSNEIENIDFGSDLSSYVELFRILNENNYISNSITKDSFEYELSRDNQKNLNKALSKFQELQNGIKASGKKTLLEVVLPPILSSLVRNAKKQTNKDESTKTLTNDLLNIFPDNAEEYRKYNLIDFIQCLSDVLFNFNDLYKLAGGLEENLKIAKINTLNLLILMDIFFDESVVSGENNDIKTMDLFTGRSENNKYIDKGFFDIKFVLDSIPSLLDFSLGMIGNELISNDTIKEIKQEILSLNNCKETWSEEFSMMFKFISKLYNKEDLPILLKGDKGIVSNDKFKIDLANEKQRNILKNAINCIGESKIIPSIIVPIIKNNLNFDWENLGIDVNSLNFKKFSKNSNLATELIDLIDAFAYATPIIELEGNENIFTSGIKSDDLELIFDSLIDCEIINPVDKSISKENNVLRQMILKLFNDESMKKVGFSLTSEIYDGVDDLKLEFGKICNIFRVIESDNSLSSLLNGSNVSMDKISGNSLSNLISAIAESDFLRPSIDTVLENSVSPAINDAGIDASYFDFKAIENKSTSKENEIALWKEEGDNIGLLIDDIKCLSTSATEIKFDLNQIIKNEVNKDKINEILVILTKMHMLSTDFVENGKIYDRVGMVSLKIIEPVLSEYISDEDNYYENIKDDFSFAKNNTNYLTANGELIEELTREEKWKKEIDKFTQVIFSLSSLQDEKGVITINVTDANSISSIKDILKGNQEKNIYGINDIIFMRSILANIINKTLNKTFEGNNHLINNSLNISDSYVYFDSFKNEMNYQNKLFMNYAKSNSFNLENESLRNVELIIRRNEMEHIFFVFETILDNVDLFEGEKIQLSRTKLLFEPVLTNLHASLTFHQPKARLQNENKNKLTFFENFVLMALDKSNLTNLSNDNQISSDAKNIMKERIVAISKVEETMDVTGFSVAGVRQDASNYRSWEEEIASLNELVQNKYTEEIIDSDILNNSNYKNIDNVILENIMKLLNKSYLLHESVSNITNILLTSVNIESYRIDTNEEQTRINYHIDAGEELFTNKIVIWDKEISNFVAIKKAITYSENGETQYINFESYDVSNSTIMIEDILPFVQKSKIMEPMFYDFIFKTIDKAGVSSYISSISDAPISFGNYSTKYEGDIYQLEKQRRDTIRYLGEEKIDIRDEIVYSNERLTSWEFESRFLDNAIRLIKDNKTLIVEGDLTDEQINNIENLFSLSYEYVGNIYDYSFEITNSINQQAIEDMIDENNYHRGYFVSELLLNLFNEKIQALNVNYLNEIKYEYSYKCFNDYEKVALKKILGMHRKFSQVATMDELNILLDHTMYKELGPGLYNISPETSEYILKRDIQNILLKDGFNSVLASEIIDGGYLEEAIKLSQLNNYLYMFNIDGIFAIDHNYPIETNVEYVWKARINERIQFGV